MVFRALSSFSHRHFKLNPNFSYPQMQSHRGFVDGKNLENTIESIQRSYELGFELVEFDADLAQRMSDRAVRVLSATDAHELLPRATTTPTHFVCKSCAYAERCWSLA